MTKSERKKKTSEAQLRASRKWDQKNPDIKRKSRNKSGCKTYIRDFADEEDLKEVEEWIAEKRKNF